jgi:hypothetical protein
MLALTLAAAMAVQSPDNPAALAALQLCRAKIAKRIPGDISAIDAKDFSRRKSRTVIRGSVTALIGMGEPAPGYAGTHHLIRAEYSFICRTDDTRVRKITINRLH